MWEMRDNTLKTERNIVKPILSRFIFMAKNTDNIHDLSITSKKFKNK